MRLARRALAALATLLLCLPAAQAAEPSADARALLQAVTASGDHRGRAFAIVDKPAGRLHVYDAQGALVASTPALLGAARGDRSVPGIGERPLERIAPHERTTPAGRFDTEAGRNLDGEHVTWFDYDAGLAIHRLRPGAAYAARAERLAADAADDKRVSLGCVVVPGAFYDAVVKPLLAGPRGGVVYVLPDSEPLQSVFAALLAG